MEPFRQGLANSSGVVGKNLMFDNRTTATVGFE